MLFAQSALRSHLSLFFFGNLTSRDVKQTTMETGEVAKAVGHELEGHDFGHFVDNGKEPGGIPRMISDGSSGDKTWLMAKMTGK